MLKINYLFVLSLVTFMCGIVLGESSLNESSLIDGKYTLPLIVFGVFIIFIGVVVLTVGYRLIRIVIVIAGFLLFAIGTYQVIEAAFDIDLWINGLISLLAGIMGMILCYCIYQIAFFLIGFSFGFIISDVIIKTFIATVASNESDETYVLIITWIIAVLSGVIFGFLAWKLEKLILVICTSFIGSFGITVGTDYLIYGDEAQFAAIIQDTFSDNLIDFDTTDYVIVAVFFVIGFVGIIFQLFCSSKNYKHSLSNRFSGSRGGEGSVIIINQR
eukprot:TRINITY_DN500_c0_g1_i3.p1 TRINITY_DN500_c0_g1~~TRINITY_DN500_c0_g1_i3.p1  ORF type:complete len:273 (+),score=43.14 TRINITY_DN500_c0_g1_i3:63-881(+)